MKTNFVNYIYFIYLICDTIYTYIHKHNFSILTDLKVHINIFYNNVFWSDSDSCA